MYKHAFSPPTKIPGKIHLQVLAFSYKMVFPTIAYKFSTEQTKRINFSIFQVPLEKFWRLKPDEPYLVSTVPTIIQ